MYSSHPQAENIPVRTVPPADRLLHLLSAHYLPELSHPYNRKCSWMASLPAALHVEYQTSPWFPHPSTTYECQITSSGMHSYNRSHVPVPRSDSKSARYLLFQRANRLSQPVLWHLLHDLKSMRSCWHWNTHLRSIPSSRGSPDRILLLLMHQSSPLSDGTATQLHCTPVHPYNGSR